MANKNDRFETVSKEGSIMSSNNLRTVIVDKETGVNYLVLSSGYGLAVTPLIDADGKPIVTKPQQ